MSTLNEKITNVADGVRTLSATTSGLTLDQMASNIEAANDEITSQSDLIGQIITALEDKAAATPALQEKTVTPTTSTQTVSPDNNYDGLSKVTVNAMPTATQATPSITVNSSGLITASATQTAGYVAAGTKTGTQQLTVQAAKTVTPSTSSQTAVASGRYTTGAVTVAAIPNTYVKPTTTKAATTYTPTTSNQTIAAGTYCSGAQTIQGDANLKPENIAEGVSIFGVTGTHSGGGSGGGDVATTRVMVENYIRVFATTYDNGFDYAARIPSGGPAVITNVVSGSCLIVINNSTPIVSGATFIQQYMVADMEGISAYLYQVN